MHVHCCVTYYDVILLTTSCSLQLNSTCISTQPALCAITTSRQRSSWLPAQCCHRPSRCAPPQTSLIKLYNAISWNWEISQISGRFCLHLITRGICKCPYMSVNDVLISNYVQKGMIRILQVIDFVRTKWERDVVIDRLAACLKRRVRCVMSFWLRAM